MNRINLAIKRFFSEGHERSIIAKKNITLTFFIKGTSILIGIVMVPLTIDYVNPTQYGLWLTMSSVIVWFNFFDIGLGNGLKNKLTEAIAQKEQQLAKEYVSTAYGLLGIISLVIILLYASLRSSIDWGTILNAPPGLNNELNTLAFYMVLMFGIAFVLQLVNIVFYALQQSAKVAMVSLVGNIFSLVLVLILKATTNGSLLYLGLSLFLGNLLSLLMYSAWFFFNEKRELRPSLRFINLKHSKTLLSLGSKFFIIQLSALVQYESTNIIISRYFSPLEVTQYNIPLKLFGAFNMGFSLLLLPLWSLVTQAYTKQDYNWIIASERKLLSIWRYMILVSVVVLLCSDFIYSVWLNDQVTIPFFTSFGVMLYMLTAIYGSLYVVILNGIGALKQQFILAIIAMILYIPLTYLLAVILKLGVLGISLSLILCNFNGIIFAPLQYKKLIVRKVPKNAVVGI
jgi:O-antigen/teichoic acid export membrane protein